MIYQIEAKEGGLVLSPFFSYVGRCGMMNDSKGRVT
jgi:hypothetical protein